MAVPILVYHRVTDSPHPALREYAVRPAVFRRQMGYLRRAGWRTLSLDELLAARVDGRALPRRSVLVTFDDAYAELTDQALPALARNGQTATIFACPGRLGADADLLRGDEHHEGALLMDADALRRARGEGFAIGSHSMSHTRLTTLDDGRLVEEVAGSRLRLAELLDAEVRHFAYPFGAHDDRVVAAVEEAGYATAVTTEPGAVVDQDAWRLPRVYVVWGEGAARLALRLRRRRREG
jgi:peptidoglycan/xylan/chitin deacetylase (PgdA/CDA1 family)